MTELDFHKSELARDGLEVIEIPPEHKITIPNTWEEVIDGIAVEHARLFQTKQLSGRWTVILSAFKEIATGNRWIHVSYSKQSQKEFTWQEARIIRSLFLADLMAYQVLANPAEHRTFREVWHLWAPMDKNPMPRFTNMV